MARQKNGPKTAGDHGPDGRFRRGNRASPGRPPGSPNRRTLAGRSLLKALEAGDEEAGLPGGFDRMKKLLLDPDARVRLGAERLVLGLLHGRPVNADPDGEDGRGVAAIDPASLALRLANFVAAALAHDGEEPEAPTA